MSKIATMDNGTMVESLKYLNYCQLAKKSLISKRFRNVIQTHRYSLPRLFVDRIFLDYSDSVDINVFDKKLSPEAYNEWVICNRYSKQIPIESQVASQDVPNGYSIFASCRDLSRRNCFNTAKVFSAGAELNNENWPLFQHFVRLITDQFIYIDFARLIYQNDILNFLAGAINSDHGRLQCEKLWFTLGTARNSQKSVTWAKNHALCNKLVIYVQSEADLNDEAILDFFVTGANCTSSIHIWGRDCSKVVTDFVQKFLDLKNSGESQLVEDIAGEITVPTAELFKRDYAEFFIKEKRNGAEQVYEFVNNAIGKKLQLSAETYGKAKSQFSFKINTL